MSVTGCPKDHTPGCCCGPCRQVSAAANLARRLARVRRVAVVPPPRALPVRATPPQEYEVKSAIAREVIARAQAARQREAELLARDLRDAHREVFPALPELPPPPKRGSPVLTPAAAYRAARARGGIVREPDLRGAS